MSNKTAMQELIINLENIKENKCKSFQEVVFFTWVLSIFDSYFEKEKQQIIDAWDDGLNKGYTGNKGDAQTYYNETFK